MPGRIPHTGFTLMEVVIAVSILTLIGLGVSGAMVSLFRSQQSVIGKDEANEFAAALGRHFYTQQSCAQSLSGLTLTSEPQDLILTDYTGYGSQPAQAIQTGYYISNTTRISRLQIREKPGALPQNIAIDDATYQRQMAQVILGLEVTQGNTAIAMSDRFFEFPLILSGNSIQTCEIEINLGEACTATGGSYDANTGDCTPRTLCQMKGSYVRATCSPSNYGCSPGIVNPLTGNHSCPSESSPTITGRFSYTQTVNCGKKCSVNVTTTEEFYVCMRCD